MPDEGAGANRLAGEASPYLRAAASQPVEWHPWNDEAFALARRLDRPILLDVGAAWCHWCHVMDRESYEDSTLAKELNPRFVCIKVDRDERPDVDARYQRAVQALSGQGGWPLTAFLTPAGDVFYGGTYFPPEDRPGQPGFRTVVRAVAEAWRARRAELTTRAETVRGIVAESAVAPAGRSLDPALLDEAVAGMARLFDPVHGGFGSAPKFPHPGALELLLGRWHDGLEPVARTIVERTLDGMARGGIHDQLGGGFHRYAVDAGWIVPHFEKLAGENAELLRVYARGFAFTGRPEWQAVARGVVRWVRDTLSDPAGGYGTSQDADAGPDDDGNYFTWTREEAAAAVPPDAFDAVAAQFDIGTAGEMAHDPARNVLFVALDPGQVARLIGRERDETEALLATGREALLRARARRMAPAVDRTRYAGWNALLAGALLEAGAILDDPWARDHALHSLRRLRAESPEPDAVPHSPSGVTGLLDDQVQVAAAALDAWEATGDAAWLLWAEALLERAWRESADPGGSGALLDRAAGTGLGLLAVPTGSVEDAPASSANGMAAITAARLGEVTGDTRWRDRARALVAAFADHLPDLGPHAATLLRAADWVIHPATHCVVIGPAGDPLAEAMHRMALAAWRPRRVVQRLTPGAAAIERVPEAARAMARHAGATAHGYLCAGTACRAPAASLAEWKDTLSARAGAGRE